MSRRSAVIEKASDFSKVGEHTFATNPVDDGDPSVYAGFIARLFGTDEAPRVVAFASARPGDGVSRTITRLVAEVERTTNMRCSVVRASELIGVSTERARITAASGSSGSLACTNRLADIAAECDLVLVDGGSLPPGGEILAVARKVDAIVMVVESGQTRRKELNHAISAITAAGGKIVGLVFHQRKRRLPAWLERLTG